MIEIKNLTKKYGQQTIFKDSNFNFPSRGLVCFLGASGCGKSTFLNLIAGFDRDYSGEILVNGASIRTMKEDDLCKYRRDNIGFIFQNYNLLSGYTVLENILLANGLNNYNAEKDSEQVGTLLKQLGMEHKKEERVEHLSGGEKQRVAIARALIHHPSIVLADEPTGALDRKKSNEIMKLLKEIAKDRLVIVITHDSKICEFADHIVTIKEQQIIGDEIKQIPFKQEKQKHRTSQKVSPFVHGLKNFKVHLTRYICISMAISIGILTFILSLSSGNIMERSIDDFKEKNTAFNNGYMKVEKESNEVFDLLKKDKRIENVYYQYIMSDISLNVQGHEEIMNEKYPMPKAIQTISYGCLPKRGENQIALNPSLAKKFQQDISKLVGKKLTLTKGKIEYIVEISGIFNADYDDFYISSDLEQELYHSMTNKKLYALSYDVVAFEDVIPVSQMLANKEIQSVSAVKEVEALQTTFENLSHLFFIVSILVLGIGLFISIILLVKQQNSRYREIGLLAALGFRKSTIRSMIIQESFLLSVVAAIFNSICIGIVYLINAIFHFVIILTIPQVILSIFGTGFVVVIISFFASFKLIQTEPAIALRK